MQDRNVYVVVSGTAGTGEDAQRIARLLVERRLAACVQTAPVHSTYRWKGAVEEADEHLFRAKTRRSLAGAVVAAIKAAHAYEVPEIVVTPILGGHAPYLDWIGAETAAPSPLPRSAPRAKGGARARGAPDARSATTGRRSAISAP
ncbi:MAG: divalent-cation tolerance protein CutA [Lentisphaerae bacterium]|nr:divalent-cation tolerance protein CutA [Lentisphaerota bacterium]